MIRIIFRNVKKKKKTVEAQGSVWKDPALPLLELQLLNAIKMRYTFIVTTVSFLNLLLFLG